ncbi:MAG: VCBS repeat-containing protein [Gammaproteobacteria bacterium]|nr:VCBS repeat-containing protein [Gammaproteobacteria bacterium]
MRISHFIRSSFVYSLVTLLICLDVHAQNGPGLAATWRSQGDGTFNVLGSSPWSGYWYPNGLWLDGDFNGDGRADFVHAVRNSDYVHVWTSAGDGTFNVGTFRPWPGYAIPNGQWFTADFNGDRRTDILHAVNNTDYVHTWLSNGNGTFNVTTFRPWNGYAIPNGVWLVDDYNNDGRADIFHAVRNSDYVHTWFSQGNGTYNVTTFRPWNGYAIPNGVWRAGDFNNDGRTDILHAVQNTDYVHTWLSRGDGTYNVTTFRPWNGYAIPNGLWIVGDFNNDSRDDILHAVQNTDYVHTWFSQGTGAYNVTTFRPWNGYAIPNGTWLVGDYNADGRADIVHAVRNSDYVHPWFSNGNGTFNVNTFRPWTGYTISSGLWRAADINGDNRTDLTHVRAIAPTRPLQVRRFNTAAITDAQTEVIVTDATRVLWQNDGAGDVACDVRFTRNGAVTAFADGNGIINSQANFNQVIGLAGNVKVVNQINWCGVIAANVIGCAPIPGTSFAVVRFSQGTITEGILWAHEHGHNRGIVGDYATANFVMNGTIANNNRRVSQAECNSYR